MTEDAIVISSDSEKSLYDFLSIIADILFIVE